MQDFQRAGGAPGASGGIALDALGGAINRVAPGATAFVHRNALFDAQYTTTWPLGSAPAGGARAARGNSRCRMAVDAALRQRPGLPELHRPQPGQLQQAYYGANYTRLTQVKAAYDPDRVFSFPQAV